MRNILILGIDNLLGSYIAARCLQDHDDQIFGVPGKASRVSQEDIVDFVSTAAGEVAKVPGVGGSWQELAAARVHLVEGNLDAFGRIPPVDEFWHFENSSDDNGRAIAMLKSACARSQASVLNYVIFGDANAPALEGAYRIFRMSLIAGRGHPRLERSGDAFHKFLSVLYAFKEEIEARSPRYFDFQALRCLGPADGVLNLMPASQASGLVMQIARKEETKGKSFSIGSPQNTPFSDLCERIGIAYGLGILPAKDFSSLNAIERVFHERTADLHDLLAGKVAEQLYSEAYRAAGLAAESTQFDEDAQIDLFESLRRDQDKAREARASRFAGVAGRLINKIISRAGSKLSYYVGGQGERTIVFLNALGQELVFWYRLLDYLMDDYRVIIWEPRGTSGPPPPFGITDQVDDVEAVLKHENIEICHFVGWCTGAKVAIDFYLRQPAAVASMAFLNCTFKCVGSPEELDSPYEQSLESLCRMMLRKPSMVGSVMKTFQARGEPNEAELFEETDREQLSLSVLALINIDLRAAVLAPFRTEQTTLNYAHQMVDFWAHDSRPKATEVHVPVLLMGAEFDQVASPATSEMAAKLFPRARHVHVAGANHHCLYDQPDFVAGMLRNFFEEPSGSIAGHVVQSEVIHAQ